MERKTIIIGAGSVGGHIALNPELYGIKGKIDGFLDDDISKQGEDCWGLKVMGGRDWIMDKQDYDVIVGIAFPKIKKEIVDYLLPNQSLKFPTLVAKNAWISKDCSLGKGVIIYPGCCINYGANVGDFVVMNMNCALGHHAQIGNYSSLAPGVCFGGHTVVGELVDVGIGVSTIQSIKINDGAVIGGQTMLVRDVPEYAKVVGVPGKMV